MTETSVRCEKACLHVFSDSVLCIGKGAMHHPSDFWWAQYVNVGKDGCGEVFYNVDAKFTNYKFYIFPGATSMDMKENI